MPSSRPGPFQITRLIAATLAGGVFLFWLIAWVLTEGGAGGLAPDVLPGSLALLAWAAVALPAFGGALYFRGRAAGAADDTMGMDGAVGTGGATGSTGGGRAQTNTIVAHALLEGPALLGGVFFLLLGTTPVVWVALPVYVLGLALTWPSADWFQEDRT